MSIQAWKNKIIKGNKFNKANYDQDSLYDKLYPYAMVCLDIDENLLIAIGTDPLSPKDFMDANCDKNFVIDFSIPPKSMLTLLGQKTVYYAKLAEFDEEIDEKKEHKHWWVRGLELNPNNDEAYLHRAFWNYNYGDKSNVIQDLNKAIELNPRNNTAFWQRAKIREKLSDFIGAIDDYSHNIELNPKDPSNYSNRAGLKYKIGDKIGAISDYTKAIELEFDNVSQKFLCYNYRGSIKAELKDFEGAINDYSKSIEIYSDQKSIYLTRGIVFYNLRRKNEAISDLQKAIELGSNQAREVLSQLYQK